MPKVYILSVLLVLCFVNSSLERVYEPEETFEEDYVTVLHRKNIKQEITPPQNVRTKRDTWRVVKKVNISTHVFKIDSNNVAFVFWKHSKSKVIFIITCNSANTTNYNKLSNKGCNSRSNFYRSDNSGQTFDLETRFKDTYVHSIFLSPLDTKFIILTDFKNRTIFTTKDEGITYKKHSVSFSPTFIYFHPSLKNLIAAFDSTQKGDNSLYVTENYGQTWKLVSKRVRNYFWAQAGYDKDLTTLHIEIASGKQIENLKISSILALSTSPYNKTIKVYKNFLEPFSVYINQEFIIVQESSNKKLYVSAKRGPFVMMKLRTEFKNHLHHVIFNSKENEILLGVIHPDQTATLYISDSTGELLTMLQTNIITEKMTRTGFVPKIDFYQVKGLRGTYIINKKGNGTLITFDKGHTWNYLTYNLKQEFSCKKHCDLILYIKIDSYYSDYTAPLLSKDSAPGIIIAQGYIGNLNEMNREINNRHQVFISVDGGHYWTRSLDTSNGYAVLNHGGMIAATPLTFTIDHDVKFTLDYADTWITVPFTKLYSRISAIITDSTAKSLIVNVFGFLQDQTEDPDVPANTWVVWSFDFSSYFHRPCETSDFFGFDHNKGKCVMGETVSNKRRNAAKKCIIGPTFTTHFTRKSCPCTKNDYNCDTLYNRVQNQDGGFDCTPINANHTTSLSGCKEGGSYLKTKGFRKLNGNKCSGGIDLNPNKVKCPVAPPELVRIDVPTGTQNAVSTPVQFKIVQTGGFYKTQYYWDFGDGLNGRKGNYSQVKDVLRVFYHHGHYKVTLYAANSAGNDSVSVDVVILDEFFMKDPYIHYNDPVIVNTDSSYSLKTIEDDGTSKKIENLKSAFYIWAFGGAVLGGKQASVVSYSFPETGVYRIEVSIITPVSHKTVTSVVAVYYDAITFDVRFSSKLDYYNTETEAWVINFSYKFKMFLAIKYDIHDTERIIVKTEPKKPTRVRVILTDRETTANVPDKSATYFANKIIKDINENRPLLHEYAARDIHVLSASLGKRWQPMKEEKKETKEGNAWVYILVTLIVLFVLGILIALYQFHKKGKLYFWRHDDGMESKLFSDVDDDCVGMEGDNVEA